MLSLDDKRSGNPHPHRLIEAFQNTVDDCFLQDMKLTGYPFTWEQGRGKNNWVEGRIDRALVSQQWLNLFPQVVLTNVAMSTSDHSLLFLDIDLSAGRLKVKRFKFENAWCKEMDCGEVIH